MSFQTNEGEKSNESEKSERRQAQTEKAEKIERSEVMGGLDDHTKKITAQVLEKRVSRRSGATKNGFSSADSLLPLDEPSQKLRKADQSASFADNVAQKKSEKQQVTEDSPQSKDKDQETKQQPSTNENTTRVFAAHGAPGSGPIKEDSGLSKEVSGFVKESGDAADHFSAKLTTDKVQKKGDRAVKYLKENDPYTVASAIGFKEAAKATAAGYEKAQPHLEAAKQVSDGQFDSMSPDESKAYDDANKAFAAGATKEIDKPYVKQWIAGVAEPIVAGVGKVLEHTVSTIRDKGLTSESAQDIAADTKAINDNVSSRIKSANANFFRGEQQDKEKDSKPVEQAGKAGEAVGAIVGSDALHHAKKNMKVLGTTVAAVQDINEKGATGALKDGANRVSDYEHSVEDKTRQTIGRLQRDGIHGKDIGDAAAAAVELLKPGGAAKNAEHSAEKGLGAAVKEGIKYVASKGGEKVIENIVTRKTGESTDEPQDGHGTGSW